MSFDDGWAAIHMEMPARVPRTEYSAQTNWALVRQVTGINVDNDSTPEEQLKARQAFIAPSAWNYDFHWNTLIGRLEFVEMCTSMGHAVYADGGVDYRDDACCPFRDAEEVLRFDPWDAFGKKDAAELRRRFETHYRDSCQAQPDGVNMTGVYISCVSGLIDLFGWEMLLTAAGTDPVRFGALTNRYCSWVQQYYDALAEADVPVVMMHDDMVWTEGAIFHPDWYRAYVFPNYRRLLAPLIDAGKKIMFTSDGNYTEFIDDIAACGVNGFVMEPTTDMRYIAERYGKTHVMVGNADTRILLSGTREAIRLEVERCMAIGKGCPGFFMAVGNHIPPNTPVENALYYNEVYEELSRR